MRKVRNSLKCVWCDEPITSKDIIGINRKLTAEDTHIFYCLPCFAEYLGCEVSDLKAKIQQFKEEGCKLFQ